MSNTFQPIERPSEVMRRGFAAVQLMGGKQIRGALIRKKRLTKQQREIESLSDMLGACALGCLLIGAGQAPDEIKNINGEKIYPNYFGNLKVENPTNTHQRKSSIPSTIIYLNDQAKWSIERIAEWLETKLGL